MTLATRLITTVFSISRLANRVELNCSLPCREGGPSFDDDGPQTSKRQKRTPERSAARLDDKTLSIAITRQPTEISTTE